MTNDPFDEFEFKPLTEGLGFHKKAEKIKSEMKSAELAQDRVARTLPDIPPRDLLFPNEKLETKDSIFNLGGFPEDTPRAGGAMGSASKSISDLIAALPPSLDFVESDSKPSTPVTGAGAGIGGAMSGVTNSEGSASQTQIFQPLARKEAPSETKNSGNTIGQILGKAKQTTGPTPLSAIPAVVNEVSRPTSSAYRERLDESFARAFPHALKGKGVTTQTSILEKSRVEAVEGDLKPTAGNALSIVLDLMVVTGVSTILLVCILAITKVNLVGMLSNAQTDGPTQLHLVLLFVAVLNMYFLTARSFLGATLGEWAFEMQLGTKEDQQQSLYPLLVAWRMMVVAATGFVLLPALSLIFKRDLLKRITRLQLYRK